MKATLEKFGKMARQAPEEKPALPAGSQEIPSPVGGVN